MVWHASLACHVRLWHDSLVRQLSFSAAQACEWAMEDRCRCRCRGRAHGQRRGFVANLKPKDPHYVPPALITLAELQRFFIVRLEERKGKAHER